ncbi:MAG: BppU family phage baseplate upper protein [Peptococcaceae bacterium]|nr:BppU family phage baseplate upper protein [Peptococcaceae bacterium]
MAQTYNKLKIDIKEPITDIITAKQNDSNSRFLDVYLYDGGVPIDLTSHEVRIYMRKPDGKEIFNNGQITGATSGRCQFELTDQALSAAGKLQAEISIWKDNVQILTAPTFDIHVVKSLRTDGSIESSNEYGAIVVLYQNLYESIDLMTTMVEQFGEPGEVAEEASIATFWQMLEYLYGVNEAALKNASVSEVLKRIGLNTDKEGSGTLFGVVNPLNELINTVKQEIVNKVIEVGALNTAKFLDVIDVTADTPFTVTGKGKCVIDNLPTNSSYDTNMSIIVDGVTIYSHRTSQYPSTQPIEFEFSESLTVTYAYDANDVEIGYVILY